MASNAAQMVKNLPATPEIQVRSLGWDNPLEKEMATHSSILAWKLPWTEEPSVCYSPWSHRVGHDWVTNTQKSYWKRSVFIAIPKKGNTKECLNYHTITLISHASKVMLNILQARFQQYMNWELPDVQAGFRKGRGTRNQIANMSWVIEKAREFQKNIYFCFIDYTKAFDCVDHSKLWKILQEMGIPDHLNCLLRNLYHTRSSQPLEPDMEQWTGSKLRKEYVKTILSTLLI